MPSFYKPGHQVRIIGEPAIYTVHTVYSPTEVSLGLLDYPDTEQDSIINVKELVYVNNIP